MVEEQAVKRFLKKYYMRAWRRTHRKAMGKRRDGGVYTNGYPGGFDYDRYISVRRTARFKATMTMKKLDAAGILDDADAQAREALHKALEVMRMPLPAKDLLAAARLVLDFTKAKPAQKQEITVNTAEEWLQAVVEDAKKAEADKGATGSS